MKNLKKYIIYILIAYILIWNLQIPYVFADWDSNQEKNNCTACGSTPTSMQVFINFEVELLWILQWASAKSNNFWTNKSSWLFAWWGLAIWKAFLKSTLEKTKKDLDSEIKAVRAAQITVVLLSVMSAEAKDAMYSIEILRKNEAYVRDYKTLQELDMSINDVIWDMWVSGIWDDHISTSVKNEIQWLQYKYSEMYWDDNKIFKILSISSDAKYSNLLMFLLRLNWFMKSTLMALGNNTPLLDMSVSRFENLYSKWSVVADINEDYIESIKREYSCISAKTCDKSVKEALKGIANIKKFKESFWRTKDTITDANQNLKEAYLSNINSNDEDDQKWWVWWLTDRQVELLYMVYGLDAYNLTSSQLETLKQNFEQIEKQSQSLIDWYNNGKTMVKDIWDTTSTTVKWVFDLIKDRKNKGKDKWKEQQQDYINWLSESEKASLSEQNYWQEMIPSTDNENFVESMQNVVDEILLVEKWKDKEITLVWVNTDTHYFVEIGKYIHSIVSDEIWDKWTDWALIKSLWETCTYQCGNHGTENCYSD